MGKNLLLSFLKRVKYGVSKCIFYDTRHLILSLAFNDFRTRYAGSYLGIVWAFIQPVCTIFVYWFVFQLGFRSGEVGDVPFILWFTCGLIPWFYFSEAWNTATNVFVEYSYLVKKIVFKINILPVVKLISALFVHLFFVGILCIVFIAYGCLPSIYWIQILYYMFCMFMLVYGLSLVTAPLMIFFRDLGQVISIVLQFGIWLTPVMWHIDLIPVHYQWIFQLNPMYYVVQGYRDSLIFHKAFWEHVPQTMYFWVLVFGVLFIGRGIYRKLEPHFADVL